MWWPRAPGKRPRTLCGPILRPKRPRAGSAASGSGGTSFVPAWPFWPRKRGSRTGWQKPKQRVQLGRILIYIPVAATGREPSTSHGGLMLEHVRRRSAQPTELLDIIAGVRRRWRLKLAMKGAVGVVVIGLLLVLAATYGIEWARSSTVAILASRLAFGVVLVASVFWLVVRPLRRRVTDDQVALYLEEHQPSLQATLVSAVEASRTGS